MKKTGFVCQECGFFSGRWLGKCPDCGQWNSFCEEDKKTLPKAEERIEAVLLKDVTGEDALRSVTGIYELDRVLGGGFVEGSSVLISGEPGIGKSTLLLQTAAALCKSGKSVLYASGEESAQQIKMRAQRLECNIDAAYVHSSGDFSSICAAVSKTRPDYIIVDSIQTLYSKDLSSAPGSVSQVRETVSSLLVEAKERGMTLILVGHVTKDGAIAGPKVIEHLVDAVLYLEGDSNYSHRLLRARKNRFGSTEEVGVFKMESTGMTEVKNPSALFLHSLEKAPGTVRIPALQGNRPIVVEIQALVAPAGYQNCRRLVTGVDINRVHILLAVLEKIAGLHVNTCDVFINVPGGLKVSEPAMDAAIICAVVSSFRNVPLSPFAAVFGEVGLSGEMRPVQYTEKRIAELKKMGMKSCILPHSDLLLENEQIKVYRPRNIVDLIEEMPVLNDY